jgi:tagatose-6-phosphate ketose/aldose isomerase
MKYLGLEMAALESKGAVHTAREICQQPDLWQKILKDLVVQRPELDRFLTTALHNARKIILTGAGTSAFVGQSLTGLIQGKTGVPTEAIASTELVSHPRHYFMPGIPTLLISFARSGNSPESVAAVSLANEICKSCYHLIITCNPDGKLARHVTAKNSFVFPLPPEANDQSLAMTSSYTGMLLAGLLIAHVEDIDLSRRWVDVLTGYGRKIIEYYGPELAEIARKNFHRAVFLGSGPFLGCARESQLKLQELTDGRIICKEDSFLGFRHGPKAVIDQSTLVSYIFSNDEYVSRYEKDLVSSMKKGRPPLLQMGLMESRLPGIQLDHTFFLSDNGAALPESFLCVCSVLPAQILGFHKSLALGFQPDTPSQTGAITRVVEGVNIYDLNN